MTLRRQDRRLPAVWETFMEYAQQHGGAHHVQQVGGVTADGARWTHLMFRGKVPAARPLRSFGVQYRTGDWIVLNTLGDVLAACPDVAREAWVRVHTAND